MKKKIKIEQLKPGMFIDRFDRTWLSHPFLRNKVKVSSEKIIRKIIECKILEVYIDTDKGLDVDDIAADEVKEQEIQAEDSGGVEQKREEKDEVKAGASKTDKAEDRADSKKDIKAAEEKPHEEKEEKDKAPAAEKKEEVKVEDAKEEAKGLAEEKDEVRVDEGKHKEEGTGPQEASGEATEGEKDKTEGKADSKEEEVRAVESKKAAEPKGIEEKVREKEAKPEEAGEDVKEAEPQRVSGEAGEVKKDEREAKKEAKPEKAGEKGDKGPSAEEKGGVKAEDAVGPEAQQTAQSRGDGRKGESRKSDIPVQDRNMTMEELRKEAIEQKEQSRVEGKAGAKEDGGDGFTVNDRRITIEELRNESRDQRAQKGFGDNKYEGHGGGGSFVVNDRRMEDREARWDGKYEMPEDTKDSKDGDDVRAPVSVQEELSKAKEVRNEAKKTIKKILEDVRFGKQIEMEKVESVVEKMVDSIFRNKDALTGLGRIKKVDEYTFMHSVSVGVLLISFGKYLGFDYDLVKAIGIGGLLHDMGKIRVPGNILTKEGKLSDDEMRMMKKHVDDSRIILEETPGINDISVYVAAHHHERLDGTGYPNHLKGEDISIFGQMSAIVDVYDALTSDRCYQKGILPTDALKKLYGWNKHFNKELLQQFVRCMGIYPVGTLVRLQSGLLGVVLSHNEDDLMYPIVRVVYDTKKDTFTMPSDIDLLEEFKRGGMDKVIGYELPEKWRIRPETYL